MNDEIKTAIRAASGQMNAFCAKEELFRAHDCGLPDRSEVIDITERLRALMFPGFFGDTDAARSDYAAGYALTGIAEKLQRQLISAFGYAGGCENAESRASGGCENAESRASGGCENAESRASGGRENAESRASGGCENAESRTSGGCENAESRASDVCARFIGALPGVQRLLLSDVEAAFEGDPAAKSRAGVVFSYPGLYAITVYRLAHILYNENVPFIPRIMTEHAHSLTGIDINAGATIGKYFFIDHGTGVVVGETTVIGDFVKLYQGVTLGALSTRQGQKLAGVKRHPTLGNRVTVYSGASILGGDTVIGDDCVIGGNAFVTASVPAHTRVSVKSPELTFREVNRTIWENA